MNGTAASAGPMPPFFVYRDFLPPAPLAGLLAWTLSNEEAFAPSLVLGGVHDPARRASRSLALAESPVNEALRDRIRVLLPDMFARTGVKPFKLSKGELQLVAYNDGDSFRPHRDTLVGEHRIAMGDRVLSGVYYFHAEPKGFSGGALRLHRFGAPGDREGDFADVAPEQNSFLVFPSWATHEVRPVHCPSRRFADSRFAINCWLYRDRE